ncbi:hypothetical protein LTR95_008777 [Oleoguttula sp. CCFEE 5521]
MRVQDTPGDLFAPEKQPRSAACRFRGCDRRQVRYFGARMHDTRNPRVMLLALINAALRKRAWVISSSCTDNQARQGHQSRSEFASWRQDQIAEREADICMIVSESRRFKLVSPTWPARNHTRVSDELRRRVLRTGIGRGLLRAQQRGRMGALFFGREEHEHNTNSQAIPKGRS